MIILLSIQQAIMFYSPMIQHYYVIIILGYSKLSRYHSYGYNKLICDYSPIDTTSYYGTIPLSIQQPYITILQLIQQIICSYNPTDTQSIIMLLFFHWYSKLPCNILLLTTYVTTPQLIQQTTMPIQRSQYYDTWYSNLNYYYSTMIQHAFQSWYINNLFRYIILIQQQIYDMTLRILFHAPMTQQNIMSLYSYHYSKLLLLYPIDTTSYYVNTPLLIQQSNTTLYSNYYSKLLR